jgi:lipid-A-disaccharide synthase
MQRLGLVAGEASGDLLAAQVVAGLVLRHPGLRVEGIGGSELAKQGMDCWYPSEALAVRGYAEVIAALPRLLRLRSSLGKRMLDYQPDVFLGVDAPDFNLKLEEGLRSKGQKVVHFVSPSIWAWRAERMAQIRRSVDHMLLVFPFEKKLYDQARIASTYVGHPLADRIPMAPNRRDALLSLGLSPDDEVVALLPGSRADEIKYMARSFIEAALELHARRDRLIFVMPAAGSQRHAEIKAVLQQFRVPSNFRLLLTEGKAYEAMAACQSALVASGTATLELALFKRPMVIAYKMHGLSYRLMRRKALMPWIGLPNILSGSMVVPEFIQDQATPEALSNALFEQLRGLESGDEIGERFIQMHHELRMGCAQRCAEVLAGIESDDRGHG